MMATQRYISTSFWVDKWIRKLDPSERYLYLYLLTTPLSNIAGVYEITLDRIAFDTGYDERTLLPMLDRFAKAGKAHFVDEGWMIIPAWPSHQNVSHESNTKKGIDRVLLDLPDSIYSILPQVNYRYEFMKELARPLKPLEAPSRPSVRPSTTLLNSTLPNLTKEEPAASAAPEFVVTHVFEPESPAPSRRTRKPPAERDPLRDALAESFRAKNESYASPALQNKKLLEISAAIRRKLGPDATTDECLRSAESLITRFWQLHESGKEFYAAFTPHQMMTAFESLWGQVSKQAEAQDMSWLEGEPA